MVNQELDDIFKKFMDKKPLFVERGILQANYVPEEISYRDDQIKQVAEVLSPSLRGQKPSNLFIYGKTGTGKTLSVSYTLTRILHIAKKTETPIKTVMLNCKLKKVADTEYRLIAQLARELGKEIPPTGLPTEEVYKAFFEAIDERKQVVIIVLDEIDQLIRKTGDEILYNFTRMHAELTQAQVCLVGISNDLTFTDDLDPRVRSSLSEEELVFPPYNALQLKGILKQRSSLAFEEGVIETGVIEKCAAYAAKEHGDARRALELLRVAGELAEREGKEGIGIHHLDHAEDKIEKDRILDVVLTQPKQHQATLFAIMCSNQKNQLFTGEVYEHYKDICKRAGLRPLTQRRVSDVIAELDMLGIIHAKIISKGRYGRMREISLATPQSTQHKIRKILEEGLAL